MSERHPQLLAGWDMTGVLRLLATLDRVLQWIVLALGGAVLIFMTCFSVFNVLIMRKALNDPIRGAEDLLILSLVAIVALAVPYGARTGSHVEIEAATRFMSPRFGKLSLLAMKVLAFGILTILSWRLYDAGTKASRFGESSQTMLISFEPFYYLLCLGVAVYALVVLTDIGQILAKGVISHNRPKGKSE